MSSRSRVLAALALGALAPLAGCGKDEFERGLAPANERATPIDNAEEHMTEEQRRALETKQEDAAAARDFDGGGGESDSGRGRDPAD